MRVLMLSKACVVGAYQKKLEELARFSDVELTAIVPPYWREGKRRRWLERAHLRGYELIVEHMALNGHFHLHFYPHLRSHIRRLKPHIVHIDEEPYNLATFQALLLAKRSGAKALIFSWQNILRRYPPPFSLMERYNLTHADYILAGSGEAMQVLRAKGYSGPLEVIPQFGVDPELFRPFPGRPEREAFTIGYVGRLVEEKGVEVLLEAVSGLEGRWCLRILGDGPLRPKLEATGERLELTERVAFESRIPSQEMPSYLNQLDVLVLPSLTRPHWKEQFGRVLVEAMACGVPVIGSASGEIPQVIGEAGLVFREGDALELRMKLGRLMEDAGLREGLSLAGRARVLACYTQAGIARDTYGVYRRMLGGRMCGIMKANPA